MESKQASTKKLSISDFLIEVPPEYCDFALQAHEFLTKYGYKIVKGDN